MAAVGYLLSDDLIFTSRITGAARALGLELRAVGAAPALEALARDRAPACVIVDLHNPGLDIATFVDALRRSATCAIVGYGSHVAADVLNHACSAGCDVVLPRSKFVEVLEQELARWYGMPSAKPPSELR